MNFHENLGLNDDPVGACFTATQGEPKPMSRKNLVPLALLSVLFVVPTSQVTAANMRSFIEAVRRKAPFVYVGSVRQVSLLTRTKFDIKARAIVDVLSVMRSPGTNPHEATIDYSSYDDKTPMLAGGPQYQLRPGVKVVAFANSFASTIPPGYLLQGSREELLQRVEALRDDLRQMSADQLKVHEITEEDRRIQLALYKSFARIFVHPNSSQYAVETVNMSAERIEKTKSTVAAADHIPADKKAELSATLSKLKPALAEISQTHQEHAETIARLVEASAHEATRQEKRPEHLKKLSQELKQSVEKFEASHPQLTAFVTEYSAILSALGI